MKKQLFATVVVALFLMVSCKNANNANSEQTSAVLVDTTEVQNISDYEELVDTLGNVLKLKFNDDASQVECILNDLSTVLTERVTASGMRYANDSIELVQWHGTTELKKGEEVLFVLEPTLLKGQLTMGHEAYSFVPCGQEKVYWVIDNASQLMDEYQALTEGMEPYTPVFAEISVISKGKCSEGFAADYDGVYEIVAFTTMRNLSTEDCK